MSCPVLNVRFGMKNFLVLSVKICLNNGSEPKAQWDAELVDAGHTGKTNAPPYMGRTLHYTFPVTGLIQSSGPHLGDHTALTLPSA